MTQSTYDPCLLFILIKKKGFGIIGMQTNDIFIFSNEVFAKKEGIRLREANIAAKKKEKLTVIIFIKFNEDFITQSKNKSIYLNQQKQCKNFRTIDSKASINLINIKGKIKKK